jgi:hypothetical protein
MRLSRPNMAILLFAMLFALLATHCSEEGPTDAPRTTPVAPAGPAGPGDPATPGGGGGLDAAGGGQQGDSSTADRSAPEQEPTTGPQVVHHAISGKVSGVVTANVLLHLDGVATATTTTDGDGSFIFTGLADGTYSLSASLAGYGFTPTQQAVTLSGSDVGGLEFVSVAGHSISGTVVGQAKSGVTITLSGAANAQAVTDSAGAFSFPDLAPGTYTLTASCAGYVIFPASIDVTLSTADVTGKTFATTRTLQWTIQNGEYALYHIVGPASFASAHLVIDGVTSTDTQARNFVAQRLSQIVFYVSHGNVIADGANFYLSVPIQQRGDALDLSFSSDFLSSEQVQITLRETDAHIQYVYSHAWTVSGVTHSESASADHTALLWAYSPPYPALPPHDLRAGVLKDYGVYLTWQDDNDAGTIATYEVFRDATKIATVTDRAYADHDARVNQDILTCSPCGYVYTVVAVPVSGGRSLNSNSLVVYSFNGTAETPTSCARSGCPAGFVCDSGGTCHEH